MLGALVIGNSGPTQWRRCLWKHRLNGGIDSCAWILSTAVGIGGLGSVKAVFNLPYGKFIHEQDPFRQYYTIQILNDT